MVIASRTSPAQAEAAVDRTVPSSTSIAHGGKSAARIPARRARTPAPGRPTVPISVSWSAEGNHTTIWVGGQRRATIRASLPPMGSRSVTSDQPWSPDGKWIAYESTRTGTSDIWIVPVDGGTPRQLTHDVRNDHCAGLVARRQVDRVHLGSRQADRCLGGAGGRRAGDPGDRRRCRRKSSIGWLPGIAAGVSHRRRRRAGIWSISLADSAEHRLTPDSLRTGSPQLSPDGKQLAFRIDHGGGISDIARDARDRWPDARAGSGQQRQQHQLVARRERGSPSPLTVVARATSG